MSQAKADIDPDSSSSDSSRLSSSATSSCTASGSGSSDSNETGSTGTESSCNSDECKHSCQPGNRDQESNGHICPTTSQSARSQIDPESALGGSSVTEESKSPTIKRDDVIHRSQSTTGRKSDTAAKAIKTSCPTSPRLEVRNVEQAQQPVESSSLSSNIFPSTSHHHDCPDNQHHRISGPITSASASKLDTNNNKDSHSTSARLDYLSSSRRSNFSKSASGSRLVHQNEPRSKVCDCLSQQCGEKEHSSRRQFIENYYNSRTRLPSATAMSSLTINSPLNRLSECDAITKRLLSSPIRTVNFSENPARRVQIGEIDKSRRASLGTNTLTEQVSLFTSNQFDSLDTNYGKDPDGAGGRDQNVCDSTTRNIGLTGEGDLRPKQQQGRSLSVCQDECLKRRFRIGVSNHSSGLNRAVSLACDSGAPKQMMTIIPLFGCDIRALDQFMKWGLVLPPAIDSAVEHILSHGVNSVGIFRKSGVKSRILTLKQRIETNQEVGLEQINRDNEFSIYDVADLVKMWFRELRPVPIMTKDLIKLISDFLQASGSLNKHATSSHLTEQLGDPPMNHGSYQRPLSNSLKQRVDSIMSPTHKALFLKALNFFASISSKSEINQMTSQNLAICLTPSLCATESDQNSIIVAQKALKYCIDNYEILF